MGNRVMLKRVINEVEVLQWYQYRADAGLTTGGILRCLCRRRCVDEEEEEEENVT